MLPRLKNLGERLLPFCAAALLALGSPALAQTPAAPVMADVPAPPAVALRVGEHAQYTRLVFDFTHLTAYNTDRGADAIVLTFTTSSKVVIPRAHFHLVDHFTVTRPDAGTLRVAIGIAPGATARDYRLNDKVVVDVYAPPSKQVAKVAAAKPARKPGEKPAARAEAAKERQQKAETKVAGMKSPAPVAGKPERSAPETLPAASPAEAPPPMPAPAAVAAAIPGAVVDNRTPQMPAAPVAPVEQEPTKVSVSTVEPTRLAVFTRFDVLWIVLDSEAAGAVAPDVSGPEAGLLGDGKVLHFKGGTAYRYTLPPKRYISVDKHSLTWDVLVTTAPRQTQANAQVNVEYDDTSKTAKLMAELQDASNPMQLHDPATGDTLDVIATSSAAERIEESRRFPDVEILPAAIGMAIRPIADDVRVNRIENYIMVTAPDGILATPGAVAGPAAVGGEEGDAETHLFDFATWRKGGITQLYRNRRLLEDKIAAATRPEERQDLLMKLGLLYFANNFGQEALGVFHLIEQENPDMDKNPNFIALRGAASAMAGHYDDAIRDLSQPQLQQDPEVDLWIGYAAAASEQWRMADRSFPSTNRLLLRYPENIAVPFTIYMAESALHLGHTDAANTLLASLDSMQGGIDSHYQAAIDYLKGEAARQEGKDDEAVKLWEPVALGLDRLYHTKASLALAQLKLQDKKITLKQAIDAVDSLRFAWRGDGLEVQILDNLGELKVKDKQYLSGLEDMKTAARLSEDLLDDNQPIKEEMSRVFADIFINGAARDVPPLEAVSIYNEFGNLMPRGPDGSTATLSFADDLISIDLLDRAEKLLEDQIRGGQLPADKIPGLGAKLATIYLLDDAPQKALGALQETSGPDGGAALDEKRTLLKARALSQLNRTDEAIGILSKLGSKDALHLKADVLWHAKKWDQAAAAIEALLPACDKPLNDEDAQLTVNAAVAYKLAEDAASLEKIKSCYGPAIASTKLADTFGVVTRQSTGSELADKATLLKITGEVDMFKGFLDSYKADKGS